jgi:hypothetical protein
MELDGIYVEYGNIKWKDITPRHMQVQHDLGVELHADGNAKVVRIVNDTSTMSHERCGEPLEGIEMMG